MATVTSELFKPSKAPLMVRGTFADNNDFHSLRKSDSFLERSRSQLSNGRPATQGSHRPATQGSNRPATQGGFRFGQLSHNAFFARHNPHPTRVKHMKGLLDIPICTVSDDGYFANPRYSKSPQFPPNGHDQHKLKMYSKYMNIPANAINVNTQRYPINTITGLQYFLGKPLNMRIFREKAVPKIGLVPITEAWQDELRALTQALGLNEPPKKPQEEPPRPRTTQYSAETGRLIPPPSRAMSRGNSRQAARDRFFNQYQHIMDEHGLENTMMQMLCQILQTDDVCAVQAWLVSAGDREKALVMDMIKSALVANDEYYKQYNESEQNNKTPPLPLINEAKPMVEGDIIGDDEVNKQIDRLSLEGPSPKPPTSPKPPSEGVIRPGSQRNFHPTGIDNVNNDEDFTRRPVTSDAFRPKSNNSCRSKSSMTRNKTPRDTPEPIRLRYTKTPVMEHNPPENHVNFDDVVNENKDQDLWNPEITIAP